MAVRIRLKRMGRKNRPFYRIDVFDKLKKRDGRSIESVGYYDPHVADDDAKVTIRTERVKHWLARGAEVSQTVKEFLLAKGIIEPSKGRKKKTEKEREARKKRRKKMGRCKSKRRQKKYPTGKKAVAPDPRGAMLDANPDVETKEQ